LGIGAAAEAEVRSSDTIAGLTAIIESDQGNPELASAHWFLAQVVANVAQWEADFVNAARHHAKAVDRQGAPKKPLENDRFNATRWIRARQQAN
jgi:hypothetical protein